MLDCSAVLTLCWPHPTLPSPGFLLVVSYALFILAAGALWGSWLPCLLSSSISLILGDLTQLPCRILWDSSCHVIKEEFRYFDFSVIYHNWPFVQKGGKSIVVFNPLLHYYYLTSHLPHQPPSPSLWPTERVSTDHSLPLEVELRD